MKVVRLVVTGLVVGAATAFVAALLRPRPRKPGVYDPVADPEAVVPGSPVPAARGVDPDGRR